MPFSCFLPPKVPESGELSKVEPFSDHYVVELSAMSSSGQDAIAAELKSFADQLKPYLSTAASVLTVA